MKVVITTLSFILLAGCSLATKTSDLDVDEIAALYFVNATDDATEVTAQFFVWTTYPECGPLVFGNCGGEGTGDPLELVDEQVSVTLNDDTQELTRDADSPVYTASIAAAQTDDELLFALSRTDGAVLESTITIPPPPAVEPVPQIFSRSDGLIIAALEDFGDDVFSGNLVPPAECLSGFQSEADGERLTFAFQDEPNDVTCDVTLTIGRLRSRAGNAGFALADVEAVRALAPLTLRSTP